MKRNGRERGSLGVTARDALGMAPPPVAVAQLANRVRNRVGALHRQMAPGFVVLLERAFGLIDTKALFTAAQLGIADLLAQGPRTATELAASLDANTDADALDRLLRYLVGRDVFTAEKDGRYANNSISEALRADAPIAWRDWVLFFGSDWNNRIFDQLPRRILDGTPAAEAAFDVGFFDYINRQNTSAGSSFNAAMAAGARMQSLLFCAAVDLGDCSRLCDVGGGVGETMIQLLDANPRMRGTVFDLQELEPAARDLLEAAGMSGRAEFRGGDFFDSVPADHDLYTLFAIIHDWDDERCIRLLGNVRTAMGRDGRVMVVEKVVPHGNGYDFAKASDMLMLVLGDGGRERTEKEYETLFNRAGLRVHRRIVLPSLFEVFELVAIPGADGPQ